MILWKLKKIYFRRKWIFIVENEFYWGNTEDLPITSTWKYRAPLKFKGGNFVLAFFFLISKNLQKCVFCRRISMFLNDFLIDFWMISQCLLKDWLSWFSSIFKWFFEWFFNWFWNERLNPQKNPVLGFGVCKNKLYTFIIMLPGRGLRKYVIKC